MNFSVAIVGGKISGTERRIQLSLEEETLRSGLQFIQDNTEAVLQRVIALLCPAEIQVRHLLDPKLQGKYKTWPPVQTNVSHLQPHLQQAIQQFLPADEQKRAAASVLLRILTPDQILKESGDRGALFAALVERAGLTAPPHIFLPDDFFQKPISHKKIAELLQKVHMQHCGSACIGGEIVVLPSRSSVPAADKQSA